MAWVLLEDEAMGFRTKTRINTQFICALEEVSDSETFKPKCNYIQNGIKGDDKTLEYFVYLISGDSYKVTEEEFKQIDEIISHEQNFIEFDPRVTTITPISQIKQDL